MNTSEIMKRTQIAAPCEAKWEDMQGDDKTRFCGDCKLHVMNAAAMTDEEVVAQIARAQRGERVCMRLYKRADGTLITENCPVGLRRLRDRARKVASFVAGALSMLLSTAVSAAPGNKKSDANAKSKPTWHSSIKSECEGQNTGATPGALNDTGHRTAAPMMGKVAYIPTREDLDRQKAELGKLKRTNPDSVEVADAMSNLASLHARFNEWKEAVALNLDAMKIYDQKQRYSYASSCCYALSTAYAQLKDSKASEQYKQKAVEYGKRKDAAPQ